MRIMKRVKGPYGRGRGWTEEEEQKLDTYRAQGLSFVEIGKALGRSTGSVMGKWIWIQERNKIEAARRLRAKIEAQEAEAASAARAKERVPYGWFYWTFDRRSPARKMSGDGCLVYKIRERHDSLDQEKWDKGLYFASREAAARAASYYRKKTKEIWI